MAKSLSHISKRFVRTCEKHRAMIYSAIQESNTEKSKRDFILKYSIISLFDAWSYYCRNLIVYSSVGSISTASGRLLPAGRFRSIHDAILFSRTDRNGVVQDEPRWHDAPTAIALARKFSVSNLSEIANALGDTNSPVNQIRLLRNFCAHERNSDCYTKLASANWRPEIVGKSVEAVLASLQSDGRRRYDFWIDELEILAGAAAQ
jgi:hypothetical protein